MNLKRKIVDDQVAEFEVDLQGPLSDAIRDLRDLQDKHWKKDAWTNLRLVWCSEDYGETTRLQLLGSRPETDAEMRKRAGRAKRKATLTRQKNRKR